MIVREITWKDGQRVVRVVDYATGKEVTGDGAATTANRKGRGTDYHNKWSMSLGVTTPRVGRAFKRACAKAGAPEPKFRINNTHGQVLIENEYQADCLRKLHPMGRQYDLNGSSSGWF